LARAGDLTLDKQVLSLEKLLSKIYLAALCGAAILLLPSAWANTSYGVDYVINGSFSLTSNGTGQLTYNTLATDWTNNGDGAGNDGYNFLFAPGTADTTGATGVDGNLKLWGPNDGSANGLPATSPDGGNYIAADGVYEVGTITQVITDLTLGYEYTVGFWWAGSQQEGFNGATTEWWDVTLGDQTQQTTIVSNPNHGFTGWQYVSFNFVADASDTNSPLLTFLAGGTPAGVPPFSLLDGVNLYQTPEPTTYALIGLGLLGIPAAARLRKRRKA
jgi:hypothetical protein